MIDQRKFRSQSFDNMDGWKSSGGKGQRRRKEEERSEKRRIRRKKMQGREKAEKSRNIVFFKSLASPEGEKSKLAEAAGVEPCGDMRDEKLHAIAGRSQNVRSTSCPEHFWKLRREKVHAAMARRTFRSQKLQSAQRSEHFWNLSFSKTAHRCGAKHGSKSMFQMPQCRINFGS